jgi:hypothetical protein
VQSTKLAWLTESRWNKTQSSEPSRDQTGPFRKAVFQFAPACVTPCPFPKPLRTHAQRTSRAIRARKQRTKGAAPGGDSDRSRSAADRPVRPCHASSTLSLSGSAGPTQTQTPSVQHPRCSRMVWSGRSSPMSLTGAVSASGSGDAAAVASERPAAAVGRRRRRRQVRRPKTSGRRHPAFDGLFGCLRFGVDGSGRLDLVDPVESSEEASRILIAMSS